MTFESCQPGLDHPDPRYPRMYATCRLSRSALARAYVDDILDDLDERKTKVMPVSGGGSSGTLLDFALFMSKGSRVAVY